MNSVDIRPPTEKRSVPSPSALLFLIAFLVGIGAGSVLYVAAVGGGPVAGQIASYFGYEAQAQRNTEEYGTDPVSADTAPDVVIGTSLPEAEPAPPTAEPIVPMEPIVEPLAPSSSSSSGSSSGSKPKTTSSRPSSGDGVTIPDGGSIRVKTRLDTSD
ncbi:hypothetical protein HYV73_02530 [Candidatus Uhrbacteria bacterium]|nr:hypothetical protein [Candidatus Uhrbacteria bacterium]